MATAPQGARSSFGITVDQAGNVWQYSPNAPGGHVLLNPPPPDNGGTETQSQQVQAAHVEIRMLKQENDHLKDRLRAIQHEHEQQPAQENGHRGRKR